MTLPGGSLGRYAVVERIGAGGMGEVFRALDTVLGREVAIKVLPALAAGEGQRVALFRREARSLARLLRDRQER